MSAEVTINWRLFSKTHGSSNCFIILMCEQSFYAIFQFTNNNRWKIYLQLAKVDHSWTVRGGGSGCNLAMHWPWRPAMIPYTWSLVLMNLPGPALVTSNKSLFVWETLSRSLSSWSKWLSQSPSSFTFLESTTLGWYGLPAVLQRQAITYYQHWERITIFLFY